MPPQMSLWSDDRTNPEQAVSDARPLPFIIADKWAFPLQSHEVDGVTFYAVQDWMRGVMGKDDVRKDIAKLKKSGLSTASRQLDYKATNGRVYQMDYTDAHGLYIITQRMEAKTGLRAAVLDFLAKAGVKMDEYRLDPEQAVSDAIDSAAWSVGDASWKEARLLSTIARKDLTDAMRDVIINMPDSFYGQSTDMMYKTLWERTTAQLRGELFAPGEKGNTRDRFGTYALIYVRLTEMLITDRLRAQESVPLAMAADIVYGVAKMIKQQSDATAAALGVDLVTGKPLLSGVR